MIKKILLALAVALPATCFAQKIGVVDAQSVMELMPEYKTAQDQYAAASKVFEDEYEVLTTEINKKIQEYQALPADTPQTIKERRQQEIQDIDQKVQAFQQRAQSDLARQQQTLMQPVQEKLINAIKAVGADNGYSMIFPDGVAIYMGTDITNVTDLVKAKLGIQ